MSTDRMVSARTYYEGISSNFSVLSMLTLYYKPTCPFSQRVLGEVETMGIKLNLKNIVEDSVAEAELMTLGGKHQTPFLYDDKGTPSMNDDLNMYESNDIIAYLERHYASAGGSQFNGLTIHQSDDTCESCQ